MRKILEEFYFGNLRPSERRMTPSSSLRQTVRMMAECMDQDDGDTLEMTRPG